MAIGGGIIKTSTYPKISIITVVFNGARTLEQTILSVINQTYDNIEYIIVDGASTDETINIIQKYERRIACWISESDKGIYDAMNKGKDIASGDFIYYLGCDDALCSYDIIEEVCKVLNSDENIDIYSGVVWIVDEETRLQKLWKRSLNLREIDKGKYMMHHQGMFVKKYILSLYPFNEGYQIFSDYELILQCYFDKNLNIYYSDLPIAFYSTAGISSVDKRGLLEYAKVMEKFKLNKTIIEKCRYRYRNQNNLKEFLKHNIKKIFYFLKIWKFIQKRRGWKNHQCKIESCRWCENKIINIGIIQ